MHLLVKESVCVLSYPPHTPSPVWLGVFSASFILFVSAQLVFLKALKCR